MKQPYIKKYRLPTYKSPLWIVVHPSLAKAVDYIEDKINTSILAKGESLSTKVLSFAYDDEKGFKVFILFLKPSSSPGEIAHECNHLKNTIFKWFGVKSSRTNDEADSYYLEDLVDYAHRTLKIFKDKKKSTISLASNELIT